MKIENLIVYFSDVRVYNRNQKMLDKREEKSMKIDYQAIYEKLAKQNGVTPQQVREDMAQAIRQAYENPKDEETKWFQKQVPCKGQIPTPEEMMDFVSQCCSENENQTFFVS